MIPQYYRALPSRTSKLTQKLVLIPDSGKVVYAQPQRLDDDFSDSEDGNGGMREETTTENIFEGDQYVRTRAEQLTKEQREMEYPRVTAYLVAEGFNLKLTSKFLAKYHMVLPRLYDDALYVPYSLPLLPGESGYRVQSNNSEKMQKGNKLMESLLDKVEQRDHHYEFYSANETGQNSTNEMIRSNSPIPVSDPTQSEFPLSQSHNSDFDPSEPQYFVNHSPSNSIMELEAIVEKDENGSGSGSGSNESSENSSPAIGSPRQDTSNKDTHKEPSSIAKILKESLVESTKDDIAVESDLETEESTKEKREKHSKRLRNKSSGGGANRRRSHVDYSKHAEIR
ncbi:unnamed protein product [Ambrosiozyma monospora]|uniref:Unnamed protein product n=1 Tax=Ambrosiozyma monospora TaxID=43982 RepID=A0ACB5TJ50_AMBMO|nr:unnamed protein product [Ambrosiozyma monospora]